MVFLYLNCSHKDASTVRPIFKSVPPNMFLIFCSFFSYILSQPRHQGPRHYHHVLTSLLLEPSIQSGGNKIYHHATTSLLQNLLSIEQQQQDDVNRAHYDSDVIIYFIPENRTKTQLLLESWPVRVLLQPLLRFSRIKQKKVAIPRLTRSHCYSRADEITKATASVIPSSVSSSFASTRITKFGIKA